MYVRFIIGGDNLSSFGDNLLRCQVSRDPEKIISTKASFTKYLKEAKVMTSNSEEDEVSRPCQTRLTCLHMEMCPCLHNRRPDQLPG